MKKNNNWYIVTGAPSSGKTTVLKYLEKNGQKIYYEWARIYIDEQLKKGKKINEIRKDEYEFQRKILKLKVNFEKKLDTEDLIFMERGIPDSTAYMKMLGKSNDKDLKSALKKCNYKKVFLMDLIEFKKDYARIENKDQAALIDSLLEKSYNDLKIKIVRVPKLTVSERARFILDNL